MPRQPQRSTLFPYTTLFRSIVAEQRGPIGIMAPEGGFFGNIAGRYSSGMPNMEYVLRGHAGERSEEHTSELQSQFHLVCRLLLEKKKEASLQVRRVTEKGR